MKSPFPGMDPYLEKHWRDVHSSLIIYARDQLQEQLPTALFARVEERVFVESEDLARHPRYPDLRVVEYSRAPGGASPSGGTALAEPVILEVEQEPISETYIEIVEVGEGHRVVTAIEMLSATNKLPGPGQKLYLNKQQEYLHGRVNLVEIDLLRSGERVLSYSVDMIPPQWRTTYQVVVRRASQPTKAEVYPVPLQERLPSIRIPLRETDEDVRLDLQALIDRAYANSRYAYSLDYRRDPEPPLAGDEAVWTDALLRQAGKR